MKVSIASAAAVLWLTNLATGQIRPTPVPGAPLPLSPPAAVTGAPTASTTASTAATLVPAQDPAKPQEPAAKPGDPAAAPPQDPAAAAAAAAAAEAAKKKTEEEQKKQQRLQKIQQVKFDRRPAAILRTWSTPPGSEEPPAAGAAAQPGQPGPTTVTMRTGEDLPPVVEQLQAEALRTGAPLPVPAGATAPTTTADGKPVEAAKPAPDPFDQALKDWARAATLGDWAGVKTFLAGLPGDDEKKAAWNQMLNGLRNPPQEQNRPNQGQPAAPFFTFDDVFGIAAAAPLKFEDATFAGLGGILQLVLQRGNLTEPLVARLLAEVRRPEKERVLSQRDAVKLLIAANLAVEAGEFLPKLEDATGGKDQEALNLLAKHFLAKNLKEGKNLFLEQAWTALQAIFAAGEIDKKQKEEALKQAVALAPRLKKGLGKAWLDQSFTKDVQRGMDILASIGVAAAEGMQAQANNPEFRKQSLTLQSTAVNALLAAAPERAKDWSVQLSILADNWLREAQAAHQWDQSTSYGPMARRDRYGNFYYYDDEAWRRQSMPMQAISTADVLDLRPSPQWLLLLEPGMQPKFAMTFAQLWLKVQEEAQAFPHIAELAKTHPPQAKELVNEFLRVWTRNHDPNAGRNNYYFYGYEQRADGIPLTRSKQERNLTELSKWVEELRKMPIGEPDQDLLTKAFTTCHSSAEVYRLEAMEKVFGSLQNLKPQTLMSLSQQMRGNLATVWRLPAEQEKNKTKRRKKDIEAEVVRGYEVAREVLTAGMDKHGEHWALLLSRATLTHDENDFRRELGNDSKFTERRQLAFDDFAAAAQGYIDALPGMLREEESTVVFDHWFYASLGASDLANVSHEHVADLKQLKAIKASLFSIEGEAGERAVTQFANKLFTQMGALNPAVKFRYLKAGLDIVGPHKQAYEAQKLFSYYQDLVSEIQLQTRVDGSTTVGHGTSFGLFVDIRHTREIERESGGFGKYLRNQNDVSYSYNYGRPTENYREKFQDMCKQSLGEHFEVLSVTFQNDTVHSRATEQYGWRITPYAYVLLKPRGPQVDRVPQLRLDLDFLDTSGYAVLPVESPVLAIDATAKSAPPRPLAKVEVTQILDERQARDGKLKLEVKATANGLLPPLADLIDLQPAEFDVVNTDDTGVQVSRFDPDQESAILTERNWMLTLQAKPGLKQHPRQFAFGTMKPAGGKLVTQRYADADLVAAPAVVDLLADYGKPSTTWIWLTAGGAVLLGLLGFLFVRRRGGHTVAATGLQLPAQLTPFTVLGLLREIQQRQILDAEGNRELQSSIERIEAGYFAADANETQDLHALATTWVAKVQRHSVAG